MVFPIITCIAVLLISNVHAKVFEVNEQNLNKFLSGKFFTLTFVDSPSCSRCRLLFPFFVQAGQVFENDPEIFLSRTHDKKLIKKWEVSELPALIYHLEGVNGVKEPQPLTVDITVDDIVDTIARLLHGNFAGLKRSYTLTVTPDNYQEMVITPRQSVLLLLKEDKKDAEAITNLERVAYAFRKDDPILIATLDVSKQTKLRDDKFKTRETPVLMWLAADEKANPKRFGGVLSAELVTMFVNERTGLNRDTEGGILEMAGRLPEADELIEQYIEDVYDAMEEPLASLAVALSSLKTNMELHKVEMLDFYLYVLDNIAASGDVGIIKDLLRSEDEQLSEKEELSTKEREQLKRHRNVLRYLQNLSNEVKEARRRQQEKEILKAEAIGAHIHTEL